MISKDVKGNIIMNYMYSGENKIYCVLRNFFLKTLRNPFYIFSLSFVIAFVLYAFNWSGTFPKIEKDTIKFFSILILFALVAGRFIESYTKDSNIQIDDSKLKKILFISTFLCYVVFALTFIIKIVPIYIIIFTEKTFIHAENNGIQYFTILALTLNAICMMLYTLLYEKERKWQYLVLIIVTIIPLVLFFNRAYYFFSFLPSGFILAKFFTKKLFISLLIACIIGAYFFGKMGDARESAKYRDGKETFYSTYIGTNYPRFLPREFFWSYFYISSPIGKLQYTINDTTNENISQDYKGLIINEILPEALSVRINKLNKYNVRKSSFGYPTYFVGTCFDSVYLYAKWRGIILYTIVLFVFVIFVIVFIDRYFQSIKIPVIALLNSLMCLCVFSNMLTYTPFYLMFFWLFLISSILRLTK